MHRQHFSPHIFFLGSSLSPEAAVKVSAQYALIQPQLIRRRHPFTTPVTTCSLLLSQGKSLCQALSSWEEDLAIFIHQPGSTLSICCLVSTSCLTLATLGTVARQASLSMGILQARILEWGAMSSSRGSSRPRDRTQVSCIGRQILYH